MGQGKAELLGLTEGAKHGSGGVQTVPYDPAALEAMQAKIAGA